jgi:hypothetical protein
MLEIAGEKKVVGWIFDDVIYPRTGETLNQELKKFLEEIENRCYKKNFLKNVIPSEPDIVDFYILFRDYEK